MAAISDQVDIDASPSAVWHVLSNVRNLPSYSASTIEVHDAPDCLTAKGDTFTQVVKVLGKRWESEWTILKYERNKLLASEGSVGPGVKFRLTQRLEELDNDRTRLRLEIHYQVPGGALGRAVARAGLEGRAKHEAKAILGGIQSAAQTEN